MTQVLWEAFKLSLFYPIIYAIPTALFVTGWMMDSIVMAVGAVISLNLTLILHILCCIFMMEMSLEDAIKGRVAKNGKRGRKAEDLPKAKEGGKEMP